MFAIWAALTDSNKWLFFYNSYHSLLITIDSSFYFAARQFAGCLSVLNVVLEINSGCSNL